jgi:proline iminopeptidase
MRVNVNGVNLFVEVLGPKLVPQGAQMIERPTIVALHGGPTDHAHMMSMVAPLLDIAQVVLYDHRGCGRSEHGDPSLWRMEQWADDVRGVCDALGIENPIVYGHSFGGMVAQMYALRHPGHASKLIFAGTCPRFDVNLSAEGFRRQGGDAASDAWKNFIAAPSQQTTSEFVKHCRHLYTISRTMDADVEARTVTNTQLLIDFFSREIKLFNVEKALSAVTTPVLILGGNEDPVMPPEYQDALEAALSNAPVTRVNFSKCGHTLAADAPNELAATLTDWARNN